MVILFVPWLGPMPGMARSYANHVPQVFVSQDDCPRRSQAYLSRYGHLGRKGTLRPHPCCDSIRNALLLTPLHRPLFLGSEIYRGSTYGAWHPLRIPRVSTVIDLVRAMGWLGPEQYRASPRAKPGALTGYHTRAYVDALLDAERLQFASPQTRARHNIGTPSNPIFPEMYRRPATGAGASLLAGELLAGGGVIHSPGGGTHHGMPDRANGFCYLNDVVLAIQSLRRHGARRVAYIDIDAHHADGVEHAFAAEPEVLLISTHEEGRWPRTGALDDRGAGQVYNLPLPRGLSDSEMALVRDQLILPVVARHRPDAIVLQCGADAVEEDPQSRLGLSNGAHWAILRSLQNMAPRLLVLGGGGYNPWTVGRLWAGNWAVLNGYEIPDVLPKAAQAVLGALRWQRPGSPRQIAPEAHWITSMADAPRTGPIRAEIRARIETLLAGRDG
ncbi:acetoin utilization protein AcuC [Roseovarius nanhaiticus]|uniref:Acetoin utilization protein AcuC n=1 Tax=Roseovarius nanhaiticus TaxID=573024 RepID=A0A1N7FAZ6_9RHOB|nr:acetoin utilization protein AcuC [Roseovarius nanhaiticus]SIR97507.1 acetoin utilization protein AcuC [Roseovarius nanhaiticus]